jgi:predicted alpha/beta-fold hydrolase
MFFGGNVQTLVNELMNNVKGEIKYDKRESFVLSDGGTIFVDYMGKSFKDEEISAAPVMFVCPGLTSTS